MDGLLMFVISVLTPWLLERLKWARWFPLMKPYASAFNRITPLVLSALVAAGITFQFDEASGVLMVSGLIPKDMVRGLLFWIVGAATQHLAYERAKSSIQASVGA